MKKCAYLILILVILGNILHAAGTEPPKTGGVYQVSTKDHLLWICTNDTSWSSDFEQTADIVFSSSDFVDGGDFYNSGNGFSPIGNSTTSFTGFYDGNNHNVENIDINRSSDSNLGFFGITSSATLHNINLVNIEVDGNSSVGGLTGSTDNSNINNCSTTVTILCNASSGGLIGYTNNDTISNCHSTCTITATGSSIGGLIGWLGNGTIIYNCYSSGDVSSSSSSGCVGGLIGDCYADLERSYSTCNTSGVVDVGGLIGYIPGYEGININIKNCYSRGNVTRLSEADSDNFGGFAGYNNGNIEKCYSTGNVYYEDAADPEKNGFLGKAEAPTKASYNGNFFDSTASNQVHDNPDYTTLTTASSETTAEMTNTSTTDNIYLIAGWDFKGETANGTDDIWNIGNGRNDGYPYLSWQFPEDDPTLPVTLSTFTAIFNNNNLTLSWETQSEEDNVGWNIYRNVESDYASAQLVTPEIIPGNGTTTEPSYYSYSDNFDYSIGQTYYYWLESIDLSGETHLYNNIATITIPDPDQNPQFDEPPVIYGLKSAPNPMRNSTKIEFTLDKDAVVDISIYNIKGELVKVLPSVIADSEELKSIYWNGKDKNGKKLSSGIYFYQLKAHDKVIDSEKLIIAK
ncbi:MAG: T9SS type A sorting domain-containing protein [Candidatus Cloacimonetes bacterium]|nr:T9SS type A sorting domain-containing protein [Candidatus Cloacimonadota bacterium]